VLPPLREAWQALWAAHGTKIMAGAAFLINGADFLLVEILAVIPPSWRPWARLIVMALDYCIIERARRAPPLWSPDHDPGKIA
jgi:hypothetical protein